MILLDTNVISEAFKPSPSQNVVDWLDRHFDQSAISSIVLFELNAGIALLDASKRRDHLGRMVGRITMRFGERIYAFDAQAANAAAEIFSIARNRGLPLQQSAKLADLQTASIALAYGLQLATRNVRDFRGIGLELINPWTA